METKIITSIDNPAIKAITKLHSPKGRKEQQRFIVEGLRATETFLDAGWQPIALYTTEQQLSLVQKRIKKITVVSDQVMKKISAATTPSGILATFAIPKQPVLDQLGPGLVLAQISDPGNMGTLIRTTAAMGKKSIVIIEGADPWSPKVVQASAGTIAMVNVFRWSWQQLVESKKDLKLCALVISDGKEPNELDLHKSLLVIGSEAHGLPQEWENDCEQKLTLEMPGKTESLNAAVAGSIALYIASLPASQG